MSSPIVTLPETDASWGVTLRPGSVDDAAAVAALVATLEESDELPHRTTHAEVADRFAKSWVDPAADMVAGVTDDGRLVAWAAAEVLPGDTTRVRAFVGGGVHPELQGRGIGTALLGWAVRRGRELVAASGKDLPARLVSYSDEARPAQHALLEGAGFTVARYYAVMRRPLDRPVPHSTLPDDVRVVPWSAELDDAVRRAHNEAFADHWGSEPSTPESWVTADPSFAPTWSFAAVATDASTGEESVVGYVMSERHEEDWAVAGYTSGYTSRLGVVRAWRGRGISVALLAAAMEAYAADGMQMAELDVDTENPSGAHGLYASLGYEPYHGERMYTVEIPDAGGAAG